MQNTWEDNLLGLVDRALGKEEPRTDIPQCFWCNREIFDCTCFDLIGEDDGYKGPLD